MLPQNTLKLWAKAAAAADIQWYLYRQTLLCGSCYDSFPPELQFANVAIFARDLQKILPLLPKNWEIRESDFATGLSSLCFWEAGEKLLELSLLCSVESQEQMQQLDRRLKKLRGNTSTASKLLGLLSVKLKNGIIRRTYNRLVEMTEADAQGMAFLCDAFTNKSPALFDSTMFDGCQLLRCGGEDYPVFPGYRQYLEAVYGDYENGLKDDIGCGLTPQEKEELRFHQQKCTEALAFVQKLAEEHQLRYYLIAGSVLGAVRHGGFIPWDDDVDIGVRVDELAQFEEKVKQHLPEGFTLEVSGPNNPYPRMFSKICYNGRCCIDIWPLVPTYLDGWKAKFTWYFAKIITKAHYYKIGHPVTRFLRIVQVMGLFLTDSMIMKLARWNERKYLGKKPTGWINIYSIYRRDKETIRTQWLEDEQTATFAGMKVPVVGCTEAYLTHLYGDYMACPPPWNRVSRHVDRF